MLLVETTNSPVPSSGTYRQDWRQQVPAELQLLIKQFVAFESDGRTWTGQVVAIDSLQRLVIANPRWAIQWHVPLSHARAATHDEYSASRM